LKAVFTNGIFSQTSRKFENYEQVNKDTEYSYEPSVGIGIGGMFFRNIPVGVLVEAMIEKYFPDVTFKDNFFYPLYHSTCYSLKIGVIF